MKLNFEQEKENVVNKKILARLNGIKGIPKEEIHQLKLITLWESITSFNENRGCKFTTHLYNRVRFAYLKHINKRKDSFIELLEHPEKKDSIDFLDDVPILFRVILEDRYLYKYSLRELRKKYNLKNWQIKVLIEESVNYVSSD